MVVEGLSRRGTGASRAVKPRQAEACPTPHEVRAAGCLPVSAELVKRVGPAPAPYRSLFVRKTAFADPPPPPAKLAAIVIGAAGR